MKKGFFSQNNRMNKKFLPIFALFFFLLGAFVILYPTKQDAKPAFSRSIQEPKKTTAPDFLKELKELLPFYD